jgi:hypothetical protein
MRSVCQRFVGITVIVRCLNLLVLRWSFGRDGTASRCNEDGDEHQSESGDPPPKTANTAARCVTAVLLNAFAPIPCVSLKTVQQ